MMPAPITKSAQDSLAITIFNEYNALDRSLFCMIYFVSLPKGCVYLLECPLPTRSLISKGIIGSDFHLYRIS